MTAVKHLTAACPVFAKLIARVGPIKISRPDYQEPYEALVSAVAHQQLHGKAAMTILGRLCAHGGGSVPAPAALLAMPDEVLRGCGFSGAKVKALRDIAARAAEGAIPNRAQARRPERRGADRAADIDSWRRPMDGGDVADFYAAAAGCVSGR